MPYKSARICGFCRARVPFGMKCLCSASRQAEAERNARFEEKRPNARERGYDSKWQKARVDFLKAHPKCAMCGDAASVVDHITPHRGDKWKFWDRKNWQALCAHCHSSKKQAIELNAAF